MANPDSLLQVAILGQVYSGKTATRIRLCSQEDMVDYIYNPTIGVEFSVLYRTEIVDGADHTSKMLMWEVSGASRFRSMIDSYVRGAQLMCFFYPPPGYVIDRSVTYPEIVAEDIMQDPTDVFLRFLQQASQKPDTPIIICLSKQDHLREEDSAQGIISNELFGTLVELTAGGRAVGVIALSAVTGRGILRWGRAMALLSAGQREQAMSQLDFVL